MARPPKPTALKVLEGNRGKRALNKNEPDPDYLNDLAPPAWMPADAQGVWRELAWKLRKAKILTVLDVTMLEQACISIATYRRASIAVSGAEVIDKDSEGGAGEKGKSAPAKRPIGFVSHGQASDVEADQPGDAATKGAAKVAAAAGAGGGSINPWLIVQSMHFKQGITALRELGMTPAARTRIMVDPQLGLFGGDGEKEKGEKYFSS